MASNKKTPRAKTAAKAVERKVDKAIAREQKWYWTFPLVRVVFTVDGQVQILERQIFNKSPLKEIPAMNILHLQNTAALQVMEGLPEGSDKSTFKALEAHILAIIPLGYMTEREFWRGTQEASSDASQPSPATMAEAFKDAVAAADTGTGDNVVAFQAPTPNPA